MSMPEWATRLVAYVHVRDDAGVSHVFGPDDEMIPDWARAKITNPSAWGQVGPRVPGPQVDYGSPRVAWDGLPGWLDITCGVNGQQQQGEHARVLVARFEAVLPTDVPAGWEWRWTGSLAMRHPGDSAGSQDGTANVDDEVTAVHILPDGSKHVRLRCWRHSRPLDLPMKWEHAVQRFDQLRRAGESSVPLPALVATITRR